jgi:prepilin-type N-terminal cleavage/methylation domain-containing protein/prepilin-type processing-associated H-X9-DG protein
MRRHFKGFTLIEVLVVVAIIALLISILLPSMAAARSNARRSVCASNLHQASLATQMYMNQNKDCVPRGGNVQRYFSNGDLHWTIVLLRQVTTTTNGIFARAKMAGTATTSFNGKSYEQRGIKLNELLWKAYLGLPVFHCPEREQDTGKREAVSYIVNEYNPLARSTGGPGFSGNNGATKTSVWKHPGKVIYLADLEKCSVSPVIQSAYEVPGTGVGDLSFLDAFDPSHLPCASGATRRVARAMHLRRFTNSLFVDGHVEGVDSLPRAGENLIATGGNEPYSMRWQRLFGVEIP